MKGEAFRFVLAGLASNLMNYLVYVIFYLGGSSLIFASVAGYLAGLYNSFYLGRRWVFNVRQAQLGPVAFRFLIVYLVGGVGMATIIKSIDYWLGWHYQVAWLAGAMFAFVNNFLGSKWLVFNRSKY